MLAAIGLIALFLLALWLIVAGWVGERLSSDGSGCAMMLIGVMLLIYLCYKYVHISV